MIQFLVDKGANMAILNHDNVFAWQTTNAEVSTLLELFIQLGIDMDRQYENVKCQLVIF